MSRKMSNQSERFFCDHIADHFGRSQKYLGKLEDCEGCMEIIEHDKGIYGSRYISGLVKKVKEKYNNEETK